jgi:carbohydrate-selective porin OprB
MSRLIDASLIAVILVTIVLPVHAQTGGGENLSGADRHETSASGRHYLLGDWAGLRTRLQESGVNFDIQYVSDSLWGSRSGPPTQFEMWNRVRATVDIDLGTLLKWDGMYFHATGLWQGGGNLGERLGLIASPSGMSSRRTFRLDSWWLEKRWREDRITVRAGQFAGQDFYGAQHYAASFIFEPMGYALDNLFNTFESFDPPSTPAAEIRVAPTDYLYLKSMVFAAVNNPFSQNPTGFVPTFRGTPMNVSEIGISLGKKASTVRAFDNVESRKGYSGLYQFGAAYNPETFKNTVNGGVRPGNYLLYWMATQALWRKNPREAKGLDATFAADWSPADVNKNNRLLTAGLRFNEPMPLPIHNTVSFGYVQNSLSSQFLAAGANPWKAEKGFELNSLFLIGALLIQPVVQYYTDPGGQPGHAVVFGFRTKLEL